MAWEDVISMSVLKQAKDVSFPSITVSNHSSKASSRPLTAHIHKSFQDCGMGNTIYALKVMTLNLGSFNIFEVTYKKAFHPCSRLCLSPVYHAILNISKRHVMHKHYRVA